MALPSDIEMRRVKLRMDELETRMRVLEDLILKVYPRAIAEVVAGKKRRTKKLKKRRIN